KTRKNIKNDSLPKFCHGDATVLISSLEKLLLASPTHPLQALHFKTIPPLQGLYKIVRSIQGAAPLATYYAPSGL
ncbi:MAG TPA: hypothetical protein PLY31_06250, partial [Tenuifilaceae bacterium]|nr:hypothetical protein [Tenuifilaceae bacterium]